MGIVPPQWSNDRPNFPTSNVVGGANSASQHFSHTFTMEPSKSLAWYIVVSNAIRDSQLYANEEQFSLAMANLIVLIVRFRTQSKETMGGRLCLSRVFYSSFL